MKKNLLLAAAALLLAPAAFAQTATPAVGRTQANERSRIRQGAASGQLTHRETTKLAAQQATIRQDKRTARADGVVTPVERQDLRQESRQASRSIYRQKHDAQTR